MFAAASPDTAYLAGTVHFIMPISCSSNCPSFASCARRPAVFSFSGAPASPADALPIPALICRFFLRLSFKYSSSTGFFSRIRREPKISAALSHSSDESSPWDLHSSRKRFSCASNVSRQKPSGGFCRLTAFITV